MKGLVSRIWGQMNWILLAVGLILLVAGAASGALFASLRVDLLASFIFIIGVALLAIAIGRIPVAERPAPVEVEIDQRRKRKPSPEAEKPEKPKRVRKAKKEEVAEEEVPESVSWDI